MKAMVLTEYESYEKLQMQEVENPVCSPGHAVIKIGAAGICYHDVIACRGHFPRTKVPGIIGHEIAGTVVEVGMELDGSDGAIAVGDRVVVNMAAHCGHCDFCNRGESNLCHSSDGLYGEVLPGAFAEYMAVQLNSLVKLPDNISFAQASIIPCALGTAYHAITKRARVRPGEDVLVTGASGGVGIHAVQVARMVGARVIAVTTSADKIDHLKENGADEVIVSPQLDFAPQVRELTNGKGVDVILNIIGEMAWVAALKSMAFQARHVFIGNLRPNPVEIRPAHAILKELSFIGTDGVSISEVKELVRLVAMGRLNPVIDSTIKLKNLRDGMKKMEESSLKGRVVVEMG